jgi:hypothetical protein
MTLLSTSALALALLATLAEGPSHDEERPGESVEEESAQPEAPVPAVAPAAGTWPASEAQGTSEPAGDSPRPGASGLRAGSSLGFDLGVAASIMGGLAFPKIPLKGTPDYGWHAPGLGAAFQLHGDFTAMDLDWRVGGRGALPGYMGLYGTVGIRKELGLWKTPRIVGRGGAGLELMLASAAGATFLMPVFLAEGEAAVEYPVIPSALDLGAGLSLDVRYGLPLGLGFNLGGFVRANLLF